ncbi:hypothetical protein AK812_SmicGene6279 [Symbiodinium microadriaticum]|uniref:Uncharacterized protein n=1 Tax=Symbiodinium microadriaticum TaxID=2951 RepID=A0A1Q9ERL0_SYMMI|nr:hypothetical protein AK812_SmicGene6279 [Symbiodinium microadriaticum]
MADLRFDDDLFDFPGAVDDEEESAESAVPDDDAASVGTERLALVRLPSPGKSEETGVRKAERHGQALKFNVSLLILRFAALTVPEVNLCVTMAAQLVGDSGCLMQIEAVRIEAIKNHRTYEDRNPSSNVAVNIWIRNDRGPSMHDQEVFRDLDQEAAAAPSSRCRLCERNPDYPNKIDDLQILHFLGPVRSSKEFLPYQTGPLYPDKILLQNVHFVGEAKEREALCVPSERKKTQPPEYGPELRDETDYYQSPKDSTPLMSSTTALLPGMHRMDVLRQHARGQHLRHGWDAMPVETPAIYQHDAYLAICHYITPELMVQDTSSRMKHMEPQALQTSSTTSGGASLSEQLAKLLLKRGGDYSHDSCVSCVFAQCDYTATFTTARAVSIGRSPLAMTLAGIWVECPRDFDDLSGMEQRSYNSQRYSGVVQDTYQNLVSFNPDRLHGSGGFEGERFVNTAYQSRNARVAPVDHVDYLKKLNFSPVQKQGTVFEVYPVKPQTSANNDTEKSRLWSRRLRAKARSEEVKPFVEALKKAWSEWERWSSCKEIKARIVITGFRDPLAAADEAIYKRDGEYVVALRGIHVDDLIGSALQGEFTFVRRHVKQWPDGSITLDQASYVNEDLTVADLKEVNAVLRYVRAAADSCVKFRGGLVITITDTEALQQTRAASLVDCKSYRHQRILRSTLAAEAWLDRARDHGQFMAMVWNEMVKADYIATMNERPLVEVVPVTDARSLWDAIHRLSTSCTDKRVEVDVAALRQQCHGLRWAPTEQMKADCMTKPWRLLRDAFRRWMAEPFVTLIDSKAPGDIGAGQDATAECGTK